MKLSFAFCCEDALSMCTVGLSPEVSFDFINAANLADHIGLLNIIAACVPRLKRHVMFITGMRRILMRIQIIISCNYNQYVNYYIV